jgi:hypothetical protein
LLGEDEEDEEEDEEEDFYIFENPSISQQMCAFATQRSWRHTNYP